jgi:hypothetical protein
VSLISPWSILWKYYLTPLLEGYNTLAFSDTIFRTIFVAIRAFPNNILRDTPEKFSILPIDTELPLGLRLLKSGESTKRTQDLAVNLMIMGRLYGKCRVEGAVSSS